MVEGAVVTKLVVEILVDSVLELVVEGAVVTELVVALVVDWLDVLFVLDVNDGVPSVVVSGVCDMMILFDVPVVDTSDVVLSEVL